MKSIMDSISDLSLLEFSGEDDSLLSADTSTSTNLFSCSPLVSTRSRPRQKGRETSVVVVDSEDLTPNKENANLSKPEAPKLSVEPQQMKRKKKFGGYNLRKSLAWDRAFFTEQGVLNPMELSMISGTATPNSKSKLEVIDEEESAMTSSALQEIEENLFKHSSGGVSVRGKKIGAGSGLSPKPPKPGALIKQTTPLVSLAKRKVLAGNDVGNRSKRSACPRPVPSPSPDTVKVPSKESKITRIPVPKSNVSASATTARSGMLSAGPSKRNQSAHPATTAQKYGEIKGLPKNPRTVPSNPKVNMANKCSATRTLTKLSGKHLDNSISETHPPSRIHQTGSGANKVPGACFSQGVSDTGQKKQPTQCQTIKSSGLRMPSPSLGFFSPAKASSSHGQSQKSSTTCKPSESSNIPKPRKMETISVNEARSKIVEGAAKNCTKELIFSKVKSEPIVQIVNKQMAGADVECDSLGFEKISKQTEVENISEHVNLKSKEQGELHENENISSMENVVFPTHQKEFLTKSHTHEQFDKEADHALDVKLLDVLSNGDQSLFQEPQSVHSLIMQRTSNDISNTVHNTERQDEDEQIKGPSSDILISRESVVLQAEHGTSLEDGRHSGEFKEYRGVKTALLNSSFNDFSKIDPEGSIQGTCKNTEQVYDAAGEFGRYGDSQEHLLNESLSISCNETAESNLEAISQQLQGEQLKIPNPLIVGEIASRKEDESDMNTSKGSPEKSIQEINGASENESKTADDQSGFIPRRPMDEENDQFIDSKAIHDTTQEFELDRLSDDCIAVSETACCTLITTVSQERRPFPENNEKDLHLTPQLCQTVKAGSDSGGNDMPTNNSSTIPESQIRDDNFSVDTSILCEVQCGVPVKIEPQAMMFAYPETNEMPREDESLVPNHGHLLHQSEFSEVSADLISNTEDSPGLLQHTVFTQSVREFDHTDRETEESHGEDAQAESFNENPVVYDCSNTHCLADTNDQFSLANDNTKNEDSHLPEFQKPSDVTVDSQDVNNILHLDSDFLPTIIVSSAEVKEQILVEDTFEGRRFRIYEHDASNHQTYREIEESHEEDAQVQSFNENPMAHDCINKHSLAVPNDQFSLADDNNISEDSHLPGFQKPGAVVTVDSQDVNNNILHLDSDFLPIVIVSSAEIKEENLVEGTFEEHNIHTNEHDASNHHTYREIEEPHEEAAQAQSFNENPVAYNCSSKHCLDVTNDQFSMTDDDDINEESPLPEFQNPSADIALDSQYVNNILHLDDCLPTNIASSAEIKEQNLGEVAFEGCRFHSNEPNASNHIQDMPENKDGNHDVDERVVELMQIDDAEEGSSDILPLVEGLPNDNVISAEFDSSTEDSEDPFSEDPFTSVVARESEEQCFLSEKSKLLASDNPTFEETIPQSSEVSSVNSETLLDVAETNTFGNDKFPDTDMLCQTKGNVDFPEDNSKIIHLEKAATKSRQEVPILKPPPNVAPFTEEWLAAIEAAGEEILTMKSGAVQNSPPEKAQHEPSPWSPVKKNQAIGPFDCTKMTKHNIQNSDPS